VDPRVSIICSVRNGEPVLRPTLESVLRQTFRDWEFLIVDDGSTDGTAELVRGYAASEPRIRLIPTAGIGRAHALNLAISEARGDWIANIDADDPSHPRRIELQLEAFEREPGYAVIATDHIVLMDSESSRWSPDLPPAPPAVIEQRDALGKGNPINHSSVMMRRGDLLQIGGYATDRKRQIDYELFVRLAAHSFRIGRLPLKLSSRRLHAAQSFEARDRLRYLLSSVSVQYRAIRCLRASSWYYALLPARFLYGLLPRSIRGRINRRRHARGAQVNDQPFATETGTG
jgi:teichuronic acid biosynthesis glycosyltransferase TuaG